MKDTLTFIMGASLGFSAVLALACRRYGMNRRLGLTLLAVLLVLLGASFAYGMLYFPS